MHNLAAQMRSRPQQGEMAELVEGTRLEIERGSDITVGSNPTLSVRKNIKKPQNQLILRLFVCQNHSLAAMGIVMNLPTPLVLGSTPKSVFR